MNSIIEGGEPMIASIEMVKNCCKESRLATEQWVAEAFVQTNKRMDELIQRVVELEKKLDDHDRRGEFCPHTGV